MLTAAERLAVFAAELSLAAGPGAVGKSAALRILDTIGCAPVATRANFAESVIAVAARTARGWFRDHASRALAASRVPALERAVLGLSTARHVWPVLALCRRD